MAEELALYILGLGRANCWEMCDFKDFVTYLDIFLALDQRYPLSRPARLLYLLQQHISVQHCATRVSNFTENSIHIETAELLAACIVVVEPWIHVLARHSSVRVAPQCHN